jgi:hypothetical protein
LAIGLVHSAYNPSFSAYFSVGTVFFSHNKSANSVFQPAYQHNRTAPLAFTTGTGADAHTDIDKPVSINTHTYTS